MGKIQLKIIIEVLLKVITTVLLFGTAFFLNFIIDFDCKFHYCSRASYIEMNFIWTVAGILSFFIIAPNFFKKYVIGNLKSILFVLGVMGIFYLIYFEIVNHFS